MDTELLDDLRDRPARLDHDAYSTLAKLRRVRPFLGPHEPQLPLQTRTPRHEGKDIDTVLRFWRDAAEGTSISDDHDGVARLITRDPEALLLAEEGGYARQSGAVSELWAHA